MARAADGSGIFVNFYEKCRQKAVNSALYMQEGATGRGRSSLGRLFRRLEVYEEVFLRGA